ncbi:MAG TPA: hypothetical protein VF631_12170 [Allosphingosinicella sp.]|jgi:hypothetical protein|uniref:hypothetical protein n=1 Tax=Allosphingosinicella sp. TaxID=2823234 RepID=UPI002F26F653
MPRSLITMLTLTAIVGCEQPNAAIENAVEPSSSDGSPTITPAASGCSDPRGVASGTIVSVRDSVDLRSGPSPTAAKLVNEKATEVMGETQFQTADNTTKLLEVCRKGKWAEVEMIEPEWLAGRRGWVPVSSVRSIGEDSSGERKYVEADFYWEEDTRAHKAELTAAVNQVVRENQQCKTVDPGTLARSRNRGSVSDPVYFVTCNGPDGEVFNVWFKRDGSSA